MNHIYTLSSTFVQLISTSSYLGLHLGVSNDLLLHTLRLELTARYGTARHGTARYGTARHGTVQLNELIAMGHLFDFWPESEVSHKEIWKDNIVFILCMISIINTTTFDST
jgi:hypothetical protein